MSISIVIPCYNEEKNIGEVVKGCMKHSIPIVVDNMSTDNTNMKAFDAGATICMCTIKGAGATTKEGISRCMNHIIVTLDGDGQHNPMELDSLIAPIKKGEADLVIGSRFLNGVGASMFRQIGIDVITWLYNVGHKEKITDAQSCYRAFTKELADACPITENGFAFSTEFLIKARAKGFRIKEVPISCIYGAGNDHSMNAVDHGLGVAFRTVKWRVKIDTKLVIFKLFRMFVNLLSGTGIGKFKLVNKLFQKMSRGLIPDTARIVNINGYQMKLRAGKDRAVGGIDELLIFKNEYEPFTTKVFKNCCREDSVVVDIGANIGYFSLLAATKADKVYAVEPEARNIRELKENIELNKFENIEVVEAAISDRIGRDLLYMSDTESGEHSLVNHKDRTYQKALKVKVTTIDKLLEHELMPVSLIKIDTEGHEMEVLRGMKETVLRYEDIFLIVEVWPDGLKESGYSVKDLVRYIRDELEFTWVFLIDEHKGLIKKQAGVKKIEDYVKKHGFSVNILCKRGF